MQCSGIHLPLTKLPRFRKIGGIHLIATPTGTTMSTPHPSDVVHYPEEDGEPMAEGDIQRDYLIYTVESLREHFRQRRDVYISGNLFIYYEEGNPKAVVAPDCFVVIGVANHNRGIYKLWEEGRPPDFVLEVTSKSTRSEDQGPKRGLYAHLGVTEYWQYDPTGSYLYPPLHGFRLEGTNYIPIERPHPFGADFYLQSSVLNLEIHLRDGELRFRNPKTGDFLLTHSETEAARQKAEQQARAEAERRQAAEARIAELEAKLHALGD